MLSIYHHPYICQDPLISINHFIDHNGIIFGKKIREEVRRQLRDLKLEHLRNKYSPTRLLNLLSPIYDRLNDLAIKISHNKPKRRLLHKSSDVQKKELLYTHKIKAYLAFRDILAICYYSHQVYQNADRVVKMTRIFNMVNNEIAVKQKFYQDYVTRHRGLDHLNLLRQTKIPSEIIDHCIRPFL